VNNKIPDITIEDIIYSNITSKSGAIMNKKDLKFAENMFEYYNASLENNGNIKE
jgi:hypothetical protein